MMVNKQRTCRCCLEEVTENNELFEFNSEVSIDSETTTNPQNFIRISNCFKNLTNISVKEEEEETSMICSQCLGDLKFCYVFQQKCLDSEKLYKPVDKSEQSLEVTQTRIIKTEVDGDFDSGVIEYVEEEYVEESHDPNNDEDTNDGFEEDEHEILRETDDNSQSEQKRLRLTSTFKGSSSPRSFVGHKDHFRRQFRRTRLSQTMEDSADRPLEDEKLSDISQLQLYQCDFCAKISVSQEEHESHEAEHEDEARYKCKKCEAKFTSRDSARDHLNTAHSNEDKSFHCQTCSKGFKNRYQLILHTRSHTGEKPFECPVCHRCFSMSSNLQKHLDTHSTEKPYQCDVCKQLFKTQRSLKFHTVCYHQPEAKVKCSQCDKSFVNKSYLKMHKIYHTGEKNFTCTICSSKYYKSSHLKRHIQNVHFKLRLMKCDYCASDFVRKETYKAHIISHHKRHLSDQEFENVLEKIKKFQPPSLDINQFTLEKQKYDGVQQVMVSEIDDDENIGNLEMIEEDSVMETEGEYFEETELYDEQ